MTTASNGSPHSEATYLFDYIGVLWSRRWWIAGIALAAGLVAAGLSLLMPNWYRSTVVLAPTEERMSMGGLGGAIGGLASLAGISVGGGNQESLAVLKSRDIIRGFIEDEQLLPVLFADKWDAAAGRWDVNDPKDVPDVRDGVQLFDRKIRSVSEDRRTELVTLSIDWKDADLAASWAAKLVTRLNDGLRQRALTEAQDSIRHLRQQLDVASQVAVRDAISRLLESELEKEVLARTTPDFAFRVVDKAVVPKRKHKPQRAFIVLVTMLLVGGVVAGGFVARAALLGNRR